MKKVKRIRMCCARSLGSLQAELRDLAAQGYVPQGSLALILLKDYKEEFFYKAPASATHPDIDILTPEWRAWVEDAKARLKKVSDMMGGRT